MVLQVFVNQMGTAYVAAYAACMKVCGLFEQPGVTVGLALLTFTGQNYGAKKYDRIKSGVWAGVILSILVNLPFAALEIFAPKFLASPMAVTEFITATGRPFPVSAARIFPSAFQSPFCGSNSGARRMCLKQYSAEIACARTVASAAPNTPM